MEEKLRIDSLRLAAFAGSCSGNSADKKHKGLWEQGFVPLPDTRDNGHNTLDEDSTRSNLDSPSPWLGLFELGGPWQAHLRLKVLRPYCRWLRNPPAPLGTIVETIVGWYLQGSQNSRVS